MATLMKSVYLLTATFSLAFAYVSLNEFINFFEPLRYRQAIGVTKPSTGCFDLSRSLVITAFGRQFELCLSRDLDSLTLDTQIINGYNRKITFDLDSFVVGELKGEDGSSVFGHLTADGIFTGRIVTRNETYFIERAKRYFNRPMNFHSVIYRGKDVDYRINISTAERRSRAFVRLGRENVHTKSRSRYAAATRVTRTRSSLNYEKDVTQKAHDRSQRRRRSSENNRSICRLSLEADHTFRQMAADDIYAIQIMVHHIQTLNHIFRSAFRDSDTSHNIRFQIARIKVHTNETEPARFLGSLDAVSFLRVMQKSSDYSKYCLALFFTDRSFGDGVLGLARPGSACGRSNTAVVTFRRENVRLLPKVTEATVAHQVGTAFGAKDISFTSECQPNVIDDNYIMNSAGTNGDPRRRTVFSPCSVRQIKAFIDNVRGKNLCLKSLGSIEESGVFCGNGVVEKGEQCDCGDEDSCKDVEPGNCCDFKTCQLTKHAECSVSNGFCCNPKRCTFKVKGDTCLPETECSYKATCSGNSSSCSSPPQKKDFTECNYNSSVCINGMCGVSICAKFGLEACFCKKRKNRCKICCLHEGKCQKAENITKMKSEIKSTYLSPGSLCLDNKGYCDVFHECHFVDIKGLRSRFDYIHGHKKGVKEITHQFWWAIFLGVVALTGCIFLLVKYGALYTVSSNPVLNDLEPARKLPWISSRQKNEEQREMIATDHSGCGN